MQVLTCQHNIQEPEASLEGLGGTYFFMNEAGKRSAIVKPCDEEPLAPCNPKVQPVRHISLSWCCRLARVRLINGMPLCRPDCTYPIGAGSGAGLIVPCWHRNRIGVGCRGLWGARWVTLA